MKTILGVALCAMLAVSGCSDATDANSAGTHGYGDDVAFVDQISAAIDGAESQGAADRQLALLEQAKTDGVVSVEIAREANRNYAECAERDGLVVEFSESTSIPDWIELSYSTTTTTTDEEMSEAWAESVIDACSVAENEWVSSIYQIQPIAMDATFRHLQRQAPLLRSCLIDAGFEPDSDANGLDLAHLAISEPTKRGEGTDCLDLAGISSF